MTYLAVVAACLVCEPLASFEVKAACEAFAAAAEADARAVGVRIDIECRALR